MVVDAFACCGLCVVRVCTFAFQGRGPSFNHPPPTSLILIFRAFDFVHLRLSSRFYASIHPRRSGCRVNSSSQRPEAIDHARVHTRTRQLPFLDATSSLISPNLPSTLYSTLLPLRIRLTNSLAMAQTISNPSAGPVRSKTTSRNTAKASTGGKAPRRPSGPRGPLDPPPPRKKTRFRPGTVALREIRKYQKSTDLLLAKLPFSRVVSVIYCSGDGIGESRDDVGCGEMQLASCNADLDEEEEERTICEEHWLTAGPRGR